MRRVALPLGPALQVGTLVLPAPAGAPGEAWPVLGLAAWMATWWLTGVVPLEATALLPIVVLPLITGTGVGAVTASYADPVIFLFLGGFLLAATLERWDLHQRFALRTVRLVGTEARRVVLGFMSASAALSMWISNTATTLMMLPIAAAVVGSAGRVATGGVAAATLLGVAYGASIGGVATLIGTPPNAIFAGAARSLAGEEIGFAEWMVVGVPVSLLMLAACWLVLVRAFGVRGEVVGLADHVDRHEARLQPMTVGERWVVAVFVATALAWIAREPKVLGAVRIPGLTDVIPGMSDAGIAIGAAALLFAVPLAGQRFPTALDWETARRIPWGVLVLFGGGLALASAFESSGLSSWMGAALERLEGAPVAAIVLATAGLFVFLTELTSNTATAALSMPIMAGVARGLGVEPLALMATAALSCSMAFMLPVATPPNAIVFSSGVITQGAMARAGLWLNLAAIALITVAILAWR